jgi:hypothetical protein
LFIESGQPNFHPFNDTLIYVGIFSVIQRRPGSRSTNKQLKYLSSYTAEILRQPSWLPAWLGRVET